MNSTWTLPGDDRPPEAPSLRRYLEILRARWWFVVLAVVVCLGGAVAYVSTVQKVYEAHTDMLITPVPNDNSTPLGLGLIRQASDPTRDVTTASRLIDNDDVAQRVVRTLGYKISPGALLKKIDVQPVAQSSIISITASESTPRRARALANAFGQAAVAVRTERLHRELDPAIARLEASIKALAPSTSGNSDPAAQPLYDQLAQLEQLRTGQDPTLRIETRAAAPKAASSPKTKLSVAAALIPGLLLGVAGAFALNVLDPRRLREDRLQALGLPILTRVPRIGRSRQGLHAFDESFRFLRTAVRFADTDEPVRTLAVTSASESEGKTTTAFQLSMAALEAGQSVLLVEADIYRPGLRQLVDWPAGEGDGRGPGMFDYLAGMAALDEIIQATATPGLRFVAAGTPIVDSITGLLEGKRGRAFVNDLAGMADVVVLDCPPVGPRSDAVLFAAEAEGVLFVVDLKRSSEEEITSAIRRLRGARANVLGAVVNRDDSETAAYEYTPGGPSSPLRGMRPRLRAGSRR